MPGHTRESAVEDLVLETLILDAAAAAVLDGDHAVDVRKLAKRGAIEALGNVATDGGGAIDGRNDSDVVARARFSAGAFVTLKRAAGNRLRQWWKGLAAGMVADEIAVH